MSELEDLLYKSLVTMPCKCIYVWDIGPYNPKACDTLEGRRKTQECPRCKAVAEYEKQRGIKS